MTRWVLRLRGLAEQLRASLFWVPAAYVVVALGVSRLTSWIDGRFTETLASYPVILDATTESARSILGAIAGATITVAGVVFSVTAVAVQLASTQFSPRVLRGFLRDRFQQNVMGVIIGTFTFTVLALAQTYDRQTSQQEAELVANLSVTLAVVLAVGATIAIIASIDHTMRSMQAGEMIRRVAMETHGRVNRLLPARVGERDPDELAAPPEPGSDSCAIRSDRYGWVQQLDHAAILRALPEDTVARVDVRAGAFVIRGAPLITVWPPPEDGERLTDAVRDAIEVGPERTMQQDVAFGIRQIVDMSLRAISPGINDPTTCVEGIVQIGGIVRDILYHDPVDRTLTREGGRRLFRPRDPSPADYVGIAFDEIRYYGAEQPPIAIALLTVIGELVDQLETDGLESRAAALRHQASLVLEAVERSGMQDADKERIAERAEDAGLR